MQRLRVTVAKPKTNWETIWSAICFFVLIPRYSGNIPFVGMLIPMTWVVLAPANHNIITSVVALVLVAWYCWVPAYFTLAKTKR